MSVAKMSGAALLGAAVVVSAWWLGLFPPAPSPLTHPAGPVITDGKPAAPDERKVLYWYDPMVPQHRFDKPGKSPFMDMDLVPRYADEAPADAGSDDAGVVIASGVMQNLGIRVAPAQREARVLTTRIPGEIVADERRQSMVHARSEGFVEALHVRTEGQRVRKGEKLADIYLPDILRAQAELLSLRGGAGSEALREAIRARLRLLGMNDVEIRNIELRQKTTERVGIYAPQDGIVLMLGIRQGAAVAPSETLFEIVDLDIVWAVLEVPESQLALLDELASVEIRVAAYPGETFAGKLDYVYPRVNVATRTTPVRVVLDNPRGRLKPGMLAEATLATHPHQALWIPTEAIIETGERQVVIQRTAAGFRPAVVTTGRTVADQTEILAGLQEGESVVVSGQFLIDSEAALNSTLARLAATAPEVKAPDPAHSHAPVPEPDHAGHVMEEHRHD